MRLKLKNIAIVEEAEIELDSISVIAGYNGTGKSSISKALYAVLSTNNDLQKKIENERKKSLEHLLSQSFFESPILLEQINKNKFKMIVICRDLSRKISSFVIQYGCDYEKIKKIINEWLDRYTNLAICEEFFLIAKNEIERVYNKKDVEYCTFLFKKSIDSIFNHQVQNLYCEQNGEIVFEYSNDCICIREKCEINKLDCDIEYGLCDNRAFYLEPRHFLDYLNQYEDEEESRFSSSTEENVISNYEYVCKMLKSDIKMQHLEEYEQIEDASKIVDKIFEDVVNGKLVYEKGTFLYKEKGQSQPIHISNIASGLKNILVIQRLIKNGSLRKGDVLIIDEPEVNLHPKWQVMFAEVLVLLSKEMNIKILINSHSPYFIHAIECKMAKYEVLNKGKFYLMQEGKNNGFRAEDVTDNVEKIYKDLYEPLEEL